MRPGLLLFICVFCATTASSSPHAREFTRDLINNNLSRSVYELDSEAGAVVLYENKTMEISYDHYEYSEIESVHRIIKIIKTDALHLANISIIIPKSDRQNYVSKIHGTTYARDGNKIVGIPVNADDIFRRKISEKEYEVDFTLPSVKEGSIIEYSYDVVTEFNDWLFTWEVQDEFPRLISEFEIIYPDKFEFTSIENFGLRPMEYTSADDAEAGKENFCHVSKVVYTDHPASSSLWIRRNIEPVKPEPYVINLKNHMQRMELQVTGFAAEGRFKHFDNSWDRYNDDFWKKKNFSKEINANNTFLDDVVDSLTKVYNTEIGKTKAIFNYVRSNFKVDKYKEIGFKKSLYSVFANREGNRPEINLLLTAMLVHAGVNAAPVILGTTGSVSPTKAFPVDQRINYLVCTALIDSNRIYLDATDKNNSFGILDTRCYNGFAWILGAPGEGVTLSPDMLTDKTAFAVKISDFTDSSAKMIISEKFGIVTSEALRKKWDKDENGISGFKHDFSGKIAANISVTSVSVDNIDIPDTSLVLTSECTLHFDKNMHSFFFNAIMAKLFDENPLKSMQRKMPVEFANKSSHTYTMNVMLPPGLIPDSASKPIKISYNDGEMTFRKEMAYYPDLHTLTLVAKLEVNTTQYEKDELATLRDFFQKVIEENEEVIAFKKADGK